MQETKLMITRRVLGGRFGLHPGPQVNRIVGYNLAILLNHHGLELNALAVMSNHYHLKIFDVRGTAADFTRDFHSNVAKQLRAAFPDEHYEVFGLPSRQTSGNQFSPRMTSSRSHTAS